MRKAFTISVLFQEIDNCNCKRGILSAPEEKKKKSSETAQFSEHKRQYLRGWHGKKIPTDLKKGMLKVILLTDEDFCPGWFGHTRGYCSNSKVRFNTVTIIA